MSLLPRRRSGDVLPILCCIVLFVVAVVWISVDRYYASDITSRYTRIGPSTDSPSDSGGEFRRGNWQSAGHEDIYGDKFITAKGNNAWGGSDAMKKLLHEQSSAHAFDQFGVFEFGVYSGGSMHGLARAVPHFRMLWGFDSFEGLPDEAPNVKTEGDHWKKGAFSSADMYGVFDRDGLMNSIKHRIDHPNVTLVPGFYSDSLKHVDLNSIRPALLVDIDVDLYISAKQCLSWLFENRLMRPGTLVRYDDWHRDPSWGEPLAHDEITREFDVKWENVSNGTPNEFMVLDYSHPAIVYKEYIPPKFSDEEKRARKREKRARLLREKQGSPLVD